MLNEPPGWIVCFGCRELSGSSGPLIPEVIHLRNATQEQRDDEVLLSLDASSGAF